MERLGSIPAFKMCGSCGRLWSSWDEFVNDAQLRLLGLQAVVAVPEASALVFEHRCGSSVSVLTGRLHNLLPDHPAAGWPSLRGSVECARHCLSLEDRSSCDLRCRHARDRDLLGVIAAIRAGSSPLPGA